MKTFRHGSTKSVKISATSLIQGGLTPNWTWSLHQITCVLASPLFGTSARRHASRSKRALVSLFQALLRARQRLKKQRSSQMGISSVMVHVGILDKKLDKKQRIQSQKHHREIREALFAVSRNGIAITLKLSRRNLVYGQVNFHEIITSDAHLYGFLTLAIDANGLVVYLVLQSTTT